MTMTRIIHMLNVNRAKIIYGQIMLKLIIIITIIIIIMLKLIIIITIIIIIKLNLIIIITWVNCCSNIVNLVMF